MRPRSREAFSNAAEVVSEARRRGTTIEVEVERLRARGVRVSRSSVRRYFGHDLTRGSGGWLVPKPADRSYHGDMFVISTEGVVGRPVRGSRSRSVISEHARAVDDYLRGRYPEGEGLRRFAGRRVAGVELETDRDRIDELRRVGDLEFLDLYVDRAP